MPVIVSSALMLIVPKSMRVLPTYSCGPETVATSDAIETGLAAQILTCKLSTAVLTEKTKSEGENVTSGLFELILTVIAAVSGAPVIVNVQTPPFSGLM